VYSNKRWNDVIYRDALRVMAAQEPERLTVVHTLTRDTEERCDGHTVRKGRLGLDLLRECIPSPTECLVYVCGPGISRFARAAARESGVEPPPQFVESVLTNLQTLGVPPQRIKREFYG
jgi:ferredoxin-NADP reductase